LAHWLKSPCFEVLSEALCRTHELACSVCPALPRSEQLARCSPGLRVPVASFVNPGGRGVLRFHVGGGCVAHGSRRGEAVALPSQAAFNEPVQYAWPLSFQLVPQAEIPFSSGDSDVEGNEVETPAHRLVDRPQAGLMVAGNHQLELRCELKIILAH